MSGSYADGIGRQLLYSSKYQQLGYDRRAGYLGNGRKEPFQALALCLAKQDSPVFSELTFSSLIDDREPQPEFRPGRGIDDVDVAIHRHRELMHDCQADSGAYRFPGQF